MQRTLCLPNNAGDRHVHRVATLLVITATVVFARPADAQPLPGRGTSAARAPQGVKAHRDLPYVVDEHKRQKLDLYVPETGDGPLPVIIWIHGGGWQSGCKDACPPLRNGYAERGYAVASINYRLSGDAVFPAQIEDCKAAIRWLRAHAEDYSLDPQRFGVWGSSAGGHLVALVGTSGDVKAFDVGAHLDQSSRVQAVCDFFGPTDFVMFVTTPGYERHATANSPEARLIGGAVVENKAKAGLAKPVAYVSQDDPAFLIVHGDEDPTVPINQSQLLYDGLKMAGVSVHFHTIKGAGHGQGFGGPEIEPMVSAFFDRLLKAESVPPNLGPATTSDSSASRVTATPAGRAGMSREAGTMRWDQVRRIEGVEDDGRVGRDRLRGPDGKYEIDGARWTYRERDFVMDGVLLKPEGRGPFPVVLISHGLGGSAERFGLTKARDMVGWGFVCIAPSYTHAADAQGNRPGAPGSGPPTKGVRRGQPAVDYGAIAENLRRARTCLDLVSGMPEVDAGRLFAYGHSMGGFVTIGLAAIEPDRLQAAAITGSGIGHHEGFPAPAAAKADHVRAPFLILHGSAGPCAILMPRACPLA